MAKRRVRTSGSARRAHAAKKKQTVADKHVGRRGATRIRTVNAPKPW